MLTSGSSAMVTARILVIAPHSCGAFFVARKRGMICFVRISACFTDKLCENGRPIRKKGQNTDGTYQKHHPIRKRGQSTDD